MIFSEELHKLYKAGVGVVQIPRQFPQTVIYIDESRRVSVCQVCQGSIPKKTSRVVVLASLRGPRKYSNGGQTSAGRYFFHRDCLNGVLDGVKQARQESSMTCWDCHADMVGLKSRSLCVGSRAMFGRICNECANSPRYRKCDSCDVLFNKYQTSPVTALPSWQASPSWQAAMRHVPDKLSFVCDYCADTDGFATVKSDKRQEKHERKFKERYDSIVDRLRNGELLR